MTGKRLSWHFVVIKSKNWWMIGPSPKIRKSPLKGEFINDETFYMSTDFHIKDQNWIYYQGWEWPERIPWVRKVLSVLLYETYNIKIGQDFLDSLYVCAPSVSKVYNSLSLSRGHLLLSAAPAQLALVLLAEAIAGGEEVPTPKHIQHVHYVESNFQTEQRLRSGHNIMDTLNIPKLRLIERSKQVFK